MGLQALLAQRWDPSVRVARDTDVLAMLERQTLILKILELVTGPKNNISLFLRGQRLMLHVDQVVRSKAILDLHGDARALGMCC